MGTTRSNDSLSEAVRQLDRLRSGDQSALGELFAAHHDRLRRMVELRMDWRLQARVDAADVLQEAFLDAAARLDGYLRDPKVPVFLWLRLIVAERLTNLHRHHLGARCGTQDARSPCSAGRCQRRARRRWRRCCWAG